MSEAPLLEFENVHARRGETDVFRGLSVRIDRGEHTAVLGPNGAGKSTLLKLLTREIYPLHRKETRLRVLGEERWDVWSLRSHMGIVSQDLHQDYRPESSGLEVVLSGLRGSVGVWGHHRFEKVELDRARQVMEALGVARLAARRYGKLSTGQQRRLLLGRALINDPEALVLDEPTGGLDLTACFQYLRTVRELMAAGKTLVLVTHHLHEIPPEVGRVVLLKDGEIVADGAKRDVLTGEALTELFDVPVRLLESEGWYQPLPG